VRAVGAIEHAEKMLGERRHVAGALAQRRQMQREHREAIHQVFAQLPVRNRLGDVAIGRGDDADVRLDFLRAADAIEAAGFEHAQQPRLHVERHLGDFIEEQRAAGGALEDAGVRARRAREAALLVTEQLGLDQRSGNRAAVDCDHRSLRAMAQNVNAFGDQLFAGPALAHDHHCRFGRCDALDQREHLLHGVRAAEQVA
jgi:hypothetical protein